MRSIPGLNCMEKPIYIRSNAGNVAYGRSRTTSAEDDRPKTRSIGFGILTSSTFGYCLRVDTTRSHSFVICKPVRSTPYEHSHVQYSYECSGEHQTLYQARDSPILQPRITCGLFIHSRHNWRWSTSCLQLFW